ncbi:sporulation delaying protein family toxin (plasmid) [Bacillus tropicus]|uniref:Sporulation delaying protein family toxin n=1 Tax=Bacillus tropicus TaxID=2026188 RepID=A0A7T2QKI7_9BACI|nr:MULTISPECIES: sporulation delaying protein family toxin [Bacillus]AJG91299.1 antimicrobial peptide, SdpC family protein [Bacillus cereus]PFU92953.1 hypothetical protein COK92_14645 [Bacillus anthracis]MCU5002956.1 sporulation delaying protein family toxin [Bacillus tropicus]OJD55650.1 hypothetical protein BAU26_25640 [Bacillus sp. N35-10-4]QPR80430.1 sporulation delaying protein family toxin [Bacillus tropicus]
MKFVEKKVRSKMIYLIVFTLFLSIATGFSKPIQAEALHKYNGKEIFAGVVFGQGEVAKKFPEVWGSKELKSANAEKTKAATNKLLDGIEKIDPNFYKQLEKATYDKNVEDINNLLIKGGNYIKQLVPDLEATAQFSDDMQYCVTFAIETAIAFLFVAIFAGTVVYSAPIDSEDASQFSNEIVIQHLVERLN